jgi:hypothetical protein
VQVISVGITKTHLLREKLGCKELIFLGSSQKKTLLQIKTHKENSKESKYKTWVLIKEFKKRVSNEKLTHSLICR